MKTVGGWMFLFGAGSFVLGLIGYEFSLLMWIDNWGTTVGHVIRGALVVTGGALWLTGANAESGQSQESEVA